MVVLRIKQEQEWYIIAFHGLQNWIIQTKIKLLNSAFIFKDTVKNYCIGMFIYFYRIPMNISSYWIFCETLTHHQVRHVLTKVRSFQKNHQILSNAAQTDNTSRTVKDYACHNNTGTPREIERSPVGSLPPRSAAPFSLEHLLS